jgi:DNA-binding LacI/PurR family transcriptional regulator
MPLFTPHATVKDIAESLGLHHTTVSKALRDHPDISRATKCRVLELAGQLHYHPNSIARNLKKQASSTLGVIVPSIRNDFFSAVIGGIEEVAYGRGFNTVVCQSNEDRNREAIHIHTLISNRVAGVLASVAQTTAEGIQFLSLRQVGIPLVLFDRVCDDVETGKVVVDDYGGATQAVELLIHRGCRRIAHLAGPTHTSIGRDRHRGYADVMERNGMAVDPRIIVHGGFDEQDGIAGCQQLLSQGELPDAIFAVNDPVAVGAYKEIRSRGLSIPDDIALVGFGDTTLASYLDPPLTTVAQWPYAIGKAAVAMLLRRIDDPNLVGTSEVQVISTELIRRGSA